ncbi:MAG: hypothetical protein IJS82_02445 [Paludibacteraceae bacterium]|nr:hypothetical protein [Paludibacteraceae bacterium]
MKRLLYILIGFSALVLSSCDSNSGTTSTTSSVAKLSAFYFAANDSMPGLAKAVFTIDERLDTGLVWNQDSILYGTSLEKVVPKFSFAATPGAAYLRMPDTTVQLTGYDTLSFTKQPIYLTIRSSDGKTTKVYEIRPTVHQVDPDLYSWTKLTDAIYPEDDSEQRVLELDDHFVMIASNGWEEQVFTSDDGASWIDWGEAQGLPYGTRVRQIISDGSTLYFGQDNFLYTSTDGVTWSGQAVSYPILTMLLYWNNEVWALVDNNGYELALWKEDSLQLTDLRPDDGDFPISDFATVAFQSASTRERAMIIGGFAMNGRSLNSRWNLEYSKHTPENNGYRLEEFSIDRPQFTTLTGISVISYNGQLLLFGGVDKDMKYFGREIMISDDEGLTWTQADSTKNRLPEVYQARQKQTAIVRDFDIYLFGGQDASITHSDVYKGRLNSIDW